MPGQKTPDTTATFSERRTRLPASAHKRVGIPATTQPSVRRGIGCLGDSTGGLDLGGVDLSEPAKVTESVDL